MAAQYEITDKHFDMLTVRELYEILRAREQVFIIEQNCPYDDIDGKDVFSYHLFMKRADGSVAACLRVFMKPDEPNTAQIGRVVTTERGAGLGRILLHAGVEKAFSMGADEIYLEAQEYAQGFYAKEGFVTVSDPFLEDGIPHVKMRRRRRAAGPDSRHRAL